MSTYTISNTKLNPNRVFILQKSELEKRLDPAYYYELRNNKFEFTYPSKTISRIVKSYSGGTPNKSNIAYWNGNICWASPKDMKGFYLSDTQDKITFEGVKNSSTKIAPIGSVLIVFRSGILQHTLPVSVTKVESSINQDLKVLVPSEDLLPEYLAVFLKTFEKRILPRIVKHSTTVQSINQEDFNRLYIPIPKIDIQKIIIGIYKTYLKQKKQNEAETEKLLASIDDYLLGELGIKLPELPENNLENRMFQATINSLSSNRYDPYFHQFKFVDNIKAIENGKYPVKELRIIIFSDLIKGTLPKSEEKEGNNSVIQINCINNDGTIYLEKLLTAKDIFSKQQKLKEGDVLVVITGATIGKIAQWIYKGEFYLGGDIVKFQTNTLVDNSFVFHFLRSSPMQLEIKRNVTGATNGHLSPDDIKRFPIPVPPLDKQKEIANHISEIRKQAQKLKDQTAEALKNASNEIERILLN